MSGSCVFVSGLSSAECASWVQAWGSVLAIFAAALLVYVQHRQEISRERNHALDETRRLLSLLSSIADDAKNCMEMIGTAKSRRDMNESDEDRQSYRRRIEMVAGALSAIPKSALPNARVMSELMKLERLLSEGHSRIDPMLGRITILSEDGAKPWIRIFNETQECAEVLRAAINAKGFWPEVPG